MIRKIAPDDRDLFLSMAKKFYQSSAVSHTIPEKYHTNTFAELMRSDEYAQCYILEHNGIAAGYALLAKTYSQEAGGIVIWLEELYISENFRGKGLGTKFLDYIENNINAARYRLEVEPGNSRATSLYNRHGYDILPYMQMIKEMQ